MANFNLPDSVIEVFWVKFGEDAQIDRGTGFKPIRIIDMNKVISQGGGFVDSLGLTEVMSYRDIILVRPEDVRKGDGNEVGYRIRKDNKIFYVIHPGVHLVGFGEWLLSGSSP